jgi:signal transduction histidine kinase
VPITATVRADPIRARQILTNLVSNALKFTEVGFIKLESLMNETEVEVRVADSGIGLTEGDAGKIFDRFEQVDRSSTRRAGGTGLGLAICKNLVEMMGGEISVQGGGQGGCTFVFTIPLAKISDD